MVLQVGMMAAGIGLSIVMAVIGILLGAVFLWLSAAKIFKLSDKSFMTPLTIAAIVGVVGFVLGFIPVVRGVISWIVTIILGVWLIKSKYRVDWGKAILVWLVYFILSLVAAFLIGLIFLGGMMGAMMGWVSDGTA